MTGILFDTNVVSETMARQPNPDVLAAVRLAGSQYLSAVTLFELEFGIRRLPSGRRRQALEAFAQALIGRFSDRILPVDRAVAIKAGEWRAFREASGRPVAFGDALIAGTALVHGLVLMTRNKVDFDGGPQEIVDPWTDPTPSGV